MSVFSQWSTTRTRVRAAALPSGAGRTCYVHGARGLRNHVNATDGGRTDSAYRVRALEQGSLAHSRSPLSCVSLGYLVESKSSMTFNPCLVLRRVQLKRPGAPHAPVYGGP